MQTRKNEEEKKVSAPIDMLQSLPQPLPDFRHLPDLWKAMQDLFRSPIEPKMLASYKMYKCPITNKLFADPVRSVRLKNKVYEREAVIEKCMHLRKIYYKDAKRWLQLVDADDIADKIKHLIEKYPDFKDHQYIHFQRFNQMSAACKAGNVGLIRQLEKVNKRLLFIPHPQSQLLPMSYAIRNEKSLSVLIEFFMGHSLKGLALASLHHPDVLGRIPLENALLFNVPVTTILKLMAWMGDSLNSFQLAHPLATHSQPTLDILLLACILQGNLAWTEKVISWGANINANLKVNKTLLETIIALGDPTIKAALSTQHGIGVKQEGEGPHSTTFLIGHSLNNRVSSQDNQVEDPASDVDVLMTIRSVCAALSEKGINRFLSLHAAVPRVANKLTVAIDNDESPGSTQRLLPSLATVLSQSKPQAQSFRLEPKIQQKVVRQSVTVYSSRLFKGKDNLTDKDAFMNAIVAGDKASAEMLLKKDHTLVYASVDAADLLGFPSRLTRISGYQYSYLIGNLQMSMMMFKYLATHQAFLQTQALGDVKEIEEKLRDRASAQCVMR